MRTSLTAALTFIATAAHLHALTISGIQKDTEVSLKAGQYALADNYTVPAGKRLVVESGAVITGVKRATLVIQGELTVKGSAGAPAIMRGQRWGGIRITDTGKAAIAGVQIAGAEQAIDVAGSAPAITDSVFARNGRGITLRNETQVTFTNCLFLENDDTAVNTGPKVVAKNCSFIKNKGFGIDAGESSPECDSCLFADNGKGGLTQSNAGSSISLSGVNCAFEGKGFGVNIGSSHGSANFTKCYWGEKSTALLKSKGESVNLPNVNDARDGSGSIKVRQDGFLTAAPKPCGATVKSKV